jgi:hypothetical protein
VPEAIAINREQIQSPTVDYLEADLFSWKPRTTFDVAFFSFWLSHIPPQRFARFWQTVSAALKPEGCAFLIDSLFEQASTARDHSLLDRSGTAQRSLNDGREFRIVKVFYEPSILHLSLGS